MRGLIDVGGGMRDVYGAGVLDSFLDNGIRFDYCIGVSAGSGNIASFIAGQRLRNYRFYTIYSMRKEYMSRSNFLHKGSYFDLDYIYSTLTEEGGEDALDTAAMYRSPTEFYVAATEAVTGQTVFFPKTKIRPHDLSVVKASCAMPAVCKPVSVDGRLYYDGGVGDPIPIRKALKDGCDEVWVILTRPRDYVDQPIGHKRAYQFILRYYPAIVKEIGERHQKYNLEVEVLKELEQQGKVVIVAPTKTCGVGTTSRDKTLLDALYQVGYEDAKDLLEQRKMV